MRLFDIIDDPMPLSEIVDDISLDFPEPLDSTILRSVRRAFREFCIKSHAWRATVEIKVVEGINFYDLDLDAHSYALAMQEANFSVRDGDSYRLTAVDGNGMERSPTGLPHHCYTSDDEFFLMEAGQDGVAKVEVKIAPTNKILEIPEKLGAKYLDVIRSGAIYHLLRTPGQAWKPDMNRYEVDQYYASFNDGILEAHREATRKMSKPKRTIQYGGIQFGHST